MRTRKGGWPLRVEKRAAGKVVTVVSNVEGDAQGLLAALRKRCGSGGVARSGLVEVQGDHRARIEEFLNGL
jgi:translation initiation factor 1